MQAIFKGMLCCLITSYIYLIPPVTKYFGALGYLCIAMVIMTPPFLPLGSHIESFIGATLGMGLGLGISAIGMACFTAVNRNIGVPNGRWLAFSLLMITAFLFGYGKAKYPKLSVLLVLGLIPPMYLFTIQVDTPKFDFLFAAKIIVLQITGCLISLMVNFLFWPISSTALVCNSMVLVLAQTRDALLELPNALKTTDYDHVKSYSLDRKIINIHETMFKLRDMFRQARYEVTYGRFDPRQIVRSVGTLGKLQHYLRILSKSVQDGQNMRESTELHHGANVHIYGARGYERTPMKDNAEVIKANLDILAEHTSEMLRVVAWTLNRLIGTFEELSDQGQPIRALPQESFPYQAAPDAATLEHLENTLKKYEQIHSKVNAEMREVPRGDCTNDPWLVASAYMYALRGVLVSVQQLVKYQEDLKTKLCKRKRLWWPSVKFSKWLQAESQDKKVRGHKDTMESEVDDSEIDEEDVLSVVAMEDFEQSPPLKREGTQTEQVPDVVSNPALSPPVRRQSIGTFLYQVQKDKENQRTWRRMLWKFQRWWQSDEVIYAFKFTIIFACLSLPAYFDSSMKWYLENHGQWALITANIVSNVAVGAMLTIGVQRFIGTILGGLYGLAIWEMSRGNQYALPACFAIFSFPFWYLFVHDPMNKVGSVSLTTYVAIIFNVWVYRSVEKKFYIVAFERIATVDAGILLTFIVHSFIAPYIARRELRIELAHTFNLNMHVISGLFNLHNEEDESSELRISKDLQANLTKVFHSILKSQGLFGQSAAEPRLRGPFQRDVYQELLSRLKHMLDLTFVIKCTLGKLPKKYLDEFMPGTNAYRRELVSVLILNLYNLSGALRTKSPLPRYLPSVAGISEVLSKMAFEKLAAESKDTFEVTTFCTYGWAMSEYAVEEEIVIELVKGIVGETELKLRLDRTTIPQRANPILLFQNKQPHQMKYD
ncbi:hypothetical protein K493DRAFT_315579 [Basidiobolus meristosporus CBS 931.73]|uniref:Putative ER transporter 6TM N-terminal domain-containing protein n=1 Tax=Basidiobolus meristosporus CBS 931.73 TaxID=1314790 RepID=A0A1Y1Y8A8_9FUNG|nr:hypothetical protein K493DRAFT_315579 [Basidiobolus meristosporus CBS 931.73]|eukprot:ORX94223.1 hypothetical protein K493DRAFT_315579 [Basidiobolus meristosporus CBS 931.73]